MGYGMHREVLLLWLVGCHTAHDAPITDAPTAEPEGTLEQQSSQTTPPDARPAPDAPPPPDAMPLPDATFADPRRCSPLFDPEVLGDYHVEIDAEEWAALLDEFLNWEAREAAGLPMHPYHPVHFRYRNGAPVPGVQIRLKGSSSWRYAVLLDDPPKMQFVLAFNEIDPDGRFLGVRKVELDMPRNDRSFLRQRLGLHYLRAIGLEAQCAASARLFINGAYYGLYTAIERLDKEFLQRNFGAADDGDLWERASILKTNEETASRDRVRAWREAGDLEELDALADLDGAIREWAGEAVINDADGYQAGMPNFYLYDHPTRGFVWIAHDLDAVVSYTRTDRSPIFPYRNRTARSQQRLVLNDPVWRERYVAVLAEAHAAHAEAGLEELVDRWAAQIADAAATDPMKPFTTARHLEAVAELREALTARRAYLDAWLTCWRDGGDDADGDGHDLCHDCDDADAAAHPDADEICNLLDDDCDGVVDDGCVTAP